MKKALLALLAFFLPLTVLAQRTTLPPASSGGSLPSGGSVGQTVVNTGPGAGTWQSYSYANLSSFPAACGANQVATQIGATPGCITLPVLSVFGRTGAVVAATNDYNFNQLAGTVNLATQASGTLASANVGTGYAWNLLGNPNGAMSISNGTNNSSFHHTSAATWLWDNTTAATVTVPQNSPIWNWCGTSWSGSASQADCTSIQVQPGVGANPAVTVSVGHTGSTGAVTWVFPGPIQSGTAGTAGGLVLPQGTAIPTPQANSAYWTAPTSIPTRYGFSLPSAGATGLFHYTTGDPGAVSFSAIALATADVSGILPVANGGTGIASGTSGGVPCYTAVTTIASSVALTANIIPKGGGAGVCPTNSSVTDNGTNVTTAENIATSGTVTTGSTTPSTLCNGGTAGCFGAPNGTAPTDATANKSVIFPDSTAVWWRMRNDGASNGTILDVAATAVNNIAFSTTPALDLTKGPTQQFSCTTAASAISPTVTGLRAGRHLTLVFIQNGTTACTLTLPATFHGQGTLGTTLSGINVQEFVVSNNGTDLYAIATMVTNMTGGTP
jgi:hypothetical protein